MSIISLFCEIDDFFLALVKHQAQYPLQETLTVTHKYRGYGVSVFFRSLYR